MKGSDYEKPSKRIVKEAERVVHLTIEETNSLPETLRRFVVAHFQVTGWYGCTIDGVKTLYIRKF